MCLVFKINLMYKLLKSKINLKIFKKNLIFFLERKVSLINKTTVSFKTFYTLKVYTSYSIHIPIKTTFINFNKFILQKLKQNGNTKTFKIMKLFLELQFFMFFTTIFCSNLILTKSLIYFL